jgi:lipoate-protein ligase B
VGRPLRVLSLDRRPYAEIEALQEELRDRVLDGDAAAEALILVEHEPVITLGRRAGPGELRVAEATLAARGIALHRSSRGGAATYHGPGQLVAYPVVRLTGGVVAHVSALAASVVALARSLGVDASFDRARPGVWVGERKLASIGVHVHRRVAIHGLALNVTRQSTSGFDAIVPCAMPGVRMTSLEEEAGAPLSVDDVRVVFGRILATSLRNADSPARVFEHART